MANQVKVPKEIQELFFEAAAFQNLSESHAKWILPSPKAFYYALRAEKIHALAWRTLRQTFPAVDMTMWAYVSSTGLATAPVLESLPKPPRAPRKAKVKPNQVVPGAPV